MKKTQELSLRLLLVFLPLCNSQEFPEIFSATEPDYAAEVDLIEGKHPYLVNCHSVDLKSSEYEMYSNGSVYVPNYGITYDTTRYLLNNDILTVCFPSWLAKKYVEDNGDFPRYYKSYFYITLIGLTISSFCLTLHLIVFCNVQELRNLPGCIIASLCIALIFSYISWMLSNLETLEKGATLCILIAYTSYYFFLSSFMWMAVMAFDVFRSLWRATGQLRMTTKKFLWLRFMSYSLFAWGVPLMFSMIVLVIESSETVPEIFRPAMGQRICWFNNRRPLLILFVTPASLIVVANVMFFGGSAFIIYTNRMRTPDSQKDALRRNFTIHYRLAMIMGLTWIVGFAPATKSPVVMTIYTLLNCFQGLFIFLACTCTSKVRNRLRAKFQILKSRKQTETTTISTFQSYISEMSLFDERKLSTVPRGFDNKAFATKI